MAFPVDWLRAQKITIDNTEVQGSGSHSSFPMLVTLDHLDTEIVDAGSNSALNGGGDIRFSTDEAGTSQLAIHVVDFVTNATAGTRRCVIWVDVTSLSTSTDTDIYIWYSKTGESQPAASSTFGSEAVWSDYEIVSTDGGITDSTGTYTFTEEGTSTGIVGPFGNSDGAKDMGGSSDGDGSFIGGVTNINDFTLQVIQRANDSTPADFNISILINNTAETSIHDIFVEGTEVLSFNQLTDEVIGGGTITTDWQWVTQTLEDGVGAEMYIDGVEQTSNSLMDDSSTTKTIFDVGGIAFAGSSWAWNGDIADVRYRGSILSDGWQETEYNNQTDPANFATAGTPFTPGGAAVLDQEAFRFFDDGTESGAVALEAQNVDLSIAIETTFQITIGTQATGDPDTQQATLQFKKVGDVTWETV